MDYSLMVAVDEVTHTFSVFRPVANGNRHVRSSWLGLLT